MQSPPSFLHPHSAYVASTANKGYNNKVVVAIHEKFPLCLEADNGDQQAIRKESLEVQTLREYVLGCGAAKASKSIEVRLKPQQTIFSSFF